MAEATAAAIRASIERGSPDTHVVRVYDPRRVPERPYPRHVQSIYTDATRTVRVIGKTNGVVYGEFVCKTEDAKLVVYHDPHTNHDGWLPAGIVEVGTQEAA